MWLVKRCGLQRDVNGHIWALDAQQSSSGYVQWLMPNAYVV